MTTKAQSYKRTSQLAALSAIAGVLMIGTSFGINQGPPMNADDAQMIAFAQTHFHQVMIGAWLQAVGPLLIMVFAVTLVSLAAAMKRISGWMTLLGASILMMVSLSEVVAYICALDSSPASMGQIGNNIGHAIQHLYFFIAAPSLFLPLGVVLLGSRVLPRAYGVLAILLGACFFILGLTSLYEPILSPAVTSFAAIQAFWWLAAAVALLIRSRRLGDLLQAESLSG